MIVNLTVADEFLDSGAFHRIREEVLTVGFETQYIQEGKGTTPVPYENVNVKSQFPEFREGLEELFNTEVSIRLSAFRSGFVGSQLHNKVHADHICAQQAVVFYMNDSPDCFGGTAFWRHRRFGWETMPTQAQLNAAHYTIEELAKDWQDEEAWEMVTLVGMKPNRMITYPCNIFHSRYPFEGVGQGASARLVWVCMMDFIA